MKKTNRKKIIVVTLGLLIVYLFYSRPMNVSQLYPMLTLDKCTQMRGYYHDGTQAALTEFTIEKDTAEFIRVIRKNGRKKFMPERYKEIEILMDGNSGRIMTLGALTPEWWI